MIPPSKRTAILTGIFLCIVAAGAAATNQIILDANQNPVAAFPGDVLVKGTLSLNGQSLEGVDMINGVPVSELGGEVQDVWVNESGDTMTGPLTVKGDLLLDSHSLKNVAEINGIPVEDLGGEVQDVWVNESGDTMTGPLTVDDDANVAGTLHAQGGFRLPVGEDAW